MNTAHVDVPLHLEVPVVTPCSTPRVLDDPVVNVVFGAVADSQHGVVDVHWTVLAGGISINSRLVVTETIDDLKSNGDRAYHEEVIAQVNFVQGDVVGTSNDAY